MKNVVETVQSPITLTGDSVRIQPHPDVAAFIQTHHEQIDTEKHVRELQEAGIPEAQPAGASVPPATTTSSDLVKIIELKTEEANHRQHKTENSGWLKSISDSMRSGRQKYLQLKAA